MEEFLKEHDGFVGAMTATLTTILVFFAKEWLDNRRDRKAESQQKLDVFKLYGEPLSMAAKALVDRLMEVFQYEAQYFRAKRRKSERDVYHYVSTMYRLCSVLGWIRAASRELSNLAVADRATTHHIQDSIQALRAALADGRVHPGARISYFGEKWQMEVSPLLEEKAEETEEAIDTLIGDELQGKARRMLVNMPAEEQQSLLRKVADYLSKELGQEPISDEILLAHRSKILRILSRTEAWIYRDWQHAIGDIMLKEATQENSLRRLEVMGYLDFERMYVAHEGDPNAHRWLERVERLFYNLNLTVDEKIDTRAAQLRKTCSALIQLCFALEDADKTNDFLSQEDRKRMQTFLAEAINPEA